MKTHKGFGHNVCKSVADPAQHRPTKGAERSEMTAVTQHTPAPPQPGSFKYLGMVNEKEKKSNPERKRVAHALTARGFPFQAQLVDGCGQVFVDVDPHSGMKRRIKQHCGYGKLCERCAFIQGVKARYTIGEKIDIILAHDEHALARLARESPPVLSHFEDIYDRWHCWEEAKGQRTKAKKRLKKELVVLARRVRKLRPLLDIHATEEAIKQAKTELKPKGPVRINEVIQQVQSAYNCFLAAIDLRQGYALQSITLTLQTDTEAKQIPASRRSSVLNFKSAVKKLREFGVLAAPGSGLITSIHSQGATHAHALYYGPKVRRDALRGSWFRATGTSYIAEVKTLLTEKEWEGAVYYMYNLPNLKKVSAADRVRYWEATKRLHHISHSGLFSSRTQAKLKEMCAQPSPSIEEPEEPSEQPPIRAVDYLMIDARDKEGGSLLEPRRAQTLHTIVEHAIESNTAQGNPPEEEDIYVLELLQNITEGHKRMDSWKDLVALINSHNATETR